MIVGTVSELTDIVVDRGEGRKRCIIAIAGPPGVGKSTLSSHLRRQLVAGGHSAAVVQMDGFHLDNATLEEAGLLDRKGAPETFDAAGFVELVRELRAHSEAVGVPEFNRDTDSVKHDAAFIGVDCRFVLVEGNYLLLDSEPWKSLQPLFDCRIFMTVEIEKLRERLVSRWLTHGFNSHDAEAKAVGNDIPNAERVMDHSVPADVVYRPMRAADLPG